ncbi:MAG: glycosyltransferase family 4 protein [Candidatus Brocadiia bacterium]
MSRKELLSEERPRSALAADAVRHAPTADAAGKGAAAGVRIGMIAGQTRYPPRHGNAVHIYQLWHRLRQMGYEVHTWGEQAIPGRIQHPRTENGLTDLLRDADVLYARFPVPYDLRVPGLVRLLRHHGLPTVCEMNAPLYEFSREWPYLKPWAIRLRTRLYLRNHLWVRTCVDHTICVSTTMADYARRHFGLGDVSVIPNGGDPELFSPARRAEGRAALGMGEGEFVVFWAGWTAMPWQGLEQLFEAARQLADDGVRFVLAGDAEHLPDSRPDNVLPLGELDYFRMPALIAAADVCLCLYQRYDWCPIGFYGSPIKLFDYMACGRPVIASAMGQISELVTDGENGLLTDGDTGEVVEKIRLLRADPDLRDSIGRAGRQMVLDEHNWQNVADRTDRIVQQVLARRSRGRASAAHWAGAGPASPCTPRHIVMVCIGRNCKASA